MTITAATLNASMSSDETKIAPYIELRFTDRVGLTPYDGLTNAERESVLTAALGAAVAALPARFIQASGDLTAETETEVARR
ncbi:hypothetical protein [Streptomyces xanthochromogenes]|uniref:Uncharacterized protein n=1 Tax=Streptomyces xanthochromogenes TaxID=67384 RepID=A0ABQ2ZW75_9ACTN|nr:hypothetical protein [Streptomyces xanthochromogenes]GGY27868.1 hypothetical protein GCM10010326_21790 [Streptomyces xanthochromogenes]